MIVDTKISRSACAYQRKNSCFSNSGKDAGKGRYKYLDVNRRSIIMWNSHYLGAKHFHSL